VNGGHDGQRLTGQVDAGEDLAAFGDTRQTLGKDLGIDVIEVQVWAEVAVK
jgi:hypothetical protein